MKLPSEGTVVGQVIKLKLVKRAILLSLEIMLMVYKDYEGCKMKLEYLNICLGTRRLETFQFTIKAIKSF